MADPKTSAAGRTVAATSSGALRGAVGTPLRNTLTIARREFRAYFNSPVGYIVVAAYALLLGVLFFFQFGFLVHARASLQPLFAAMSWLMPLLAAAISMRTFSEERRLGTIELLITMPVRDGEVVIGKFLGAMGLYTFTLCATLVYPIAVSRMGDLDMGPVWGGYIGLLLGGGAYIAFGMLVSSYVADQIGSFFLAFIVGFLFFMLDKGLALLSVPTWLAPYLEQICPDFHLQSIARGVIDSRNVVYFASIIAACLLATSRSLASRRWR
jgi:ABC-2 type transport system permease protein